jgi:uncharacterized protein
MLKVAPFTAALAFVLGGQMALGQAIDMRTYPGPGITVTGRAEVAATPDGAVLRLGAVSQAEQAAEAQKQVNQIVEKTIEGVRGLGVPADRVTTFGLSLYPIYEQFRPGARASQPRIVGYRATNTIQVEIDDLANVGPVIDAGIAAGANRVDDLMFRLRDDAAYRTRALHLAVQDARSKAQAIANATGVQIQRVFEVAEGQVDMIPPRMEMMRAALAADVPTPIEPGQIRVEALITVRYQVLAPD